MSVDAVVRHASEVLRRAHRLFGDPDEPAAPSSTATVAGAVALTAAGRPLTATLSGRLADRHDTFTATAANRLQALADADELLGTRLHDAAGADRTGRRLSGRVVDDTAHEAALRSPLSGTPAGQRALVMAMRRRVTEQSRVVAAFQARDARMATLLRELLYRRGATGGYGAAGGYGGAVPRLGPATTGFPSWGLPAAGHGISGDRIRILDTADVRSADTDPGGPLTKDSGPRDCAAALIAQAHRRGYTPAQTRAILSTMLQESGGLPRAVSPNGLWRCLFQQDASYPGRDDPNMAISGFLNRLAAKGGPSSPNIWKAIFWLQQAPGAASAQAAYASGRRAYLREIQSQLGRATAMYDDLTAR